MKRRRLKESLERYVVDTGVLIEYVVGNSLYRSVVEKLLDDASKKIVELYVTPLTISELIYVASRIYELVGIEKSNEEALNFVEWLITRIKITRLTSDIVLEAGELKKKFRIALTDCYVIAMAIKLQARALFLKPEKEMLIREKELRELNVKFLIET